MLDYSLSSFCRSFATKLSDQGPFDFDTKSNTAEWVALIDFSLTKTGSQKVIAEKRLPTGPSFGKFRKLAWGKFLDTPLYLFRFSSVIVISQFIYR